MRCPLTPQGSSSLDPFARLNWAHLHTTSARLWENPRALPLDPAKGSSPLWTPSRAIEWRLLHPVFACLCRDFAFTETNFLHNRTLYAKMASIKRRPPQALFYIGKHLFSYAVSTRTIPNCEFRIRLTHFHPAAPTSPSLCRPCHSLPPRRHHPPRRAGES